MPFYESVCIARQDISATQIEALNLSLAEIVQQNGGTVAKTEYWGVRTLAYRIKKNRKGHYTLLNIDAPSAAIKELERQMRINEDVLRYMTVRVDELEEGPSAMMQSRQTRDDRGRRGGRWRDGEEGGRREFGPRRDEEDGKREGGARRDAEPARFTPTDQGANT